jgi:hypothetical protein
MIGGLTRLIPAHLYLFFYVKVSHLFGAFKRERYEGLSAVAKDALTEEESRLWKQWDSLRCEMHKFALASQHYVGSVFQGDNFRQFLMSRCMSSIIGLCRLYELSIYV